MPQPERRPRRYDALPWCCVRIVKGSRVLSPLHKLVFEEHYALAKDGAGARISARDVGHRLGVARVTVERARADLKNWGLLRKLDRGEGRKDDWFPVFPIAYPAVKRLSDDELDRNVERLDGHLTGYAAGGQSDTEADRDRPHSPREGASGTVEPDGTVPERTLNE